jgi:hypothetical protein
MNALTQDFMRIASGSSACRRMARYSSVTGGGQMMIRWTEVGLAITIAAFALLFVYCVVFAFRTGHVGAPF